MEAKDFKLAVEEVKDKFSIFADPEVFKKYNVKVADFLEAIRNFV